MKAVLLAAGLGSRLRPITDTVPKCLVPIHGRPLLEIWLDQLKKHGLGPFLINTHYLSEKVESYISTSPFRDVVTLTYEPELLGTAGTVWANRDWIGDEPIMLVHADNLCLCNFTSFIESHEFGSSKACMTMMTFETNEPESCGIIELDEKGMVSVMHEKVTDPPGRIANGAVYIIEPEMINSMRGKNDLSLEIVPQYYGRIRVWHNDVFHEDIGTMKKYKNACKMAKHLLATNEI